MESCELCEAFGQRLRRLRVASGISQEAIGEKLGISKAAVSQIELGQRYDVTVNRLRQLAQMFGVTVDHLIGHSVRIPEE